MLSKTILRSAFLWIDFVITSMRRGLEVTRRLMFCLFVVAMVVVVGRMVVVVVVTMVVVVVVVMVVVAVVVTEMAVIAVLVLTVVLELVLVLMVLVMVVLMVLVMVVLEVALTARAVLSSGDNKQTPITPPWTIGSFSSILASTHAIETFAFRFRVSLARPIECSDLVPRIAIQA